MRRIVFTGSVALSLLVVAACSSNGDQPSEARLGNQSAPIIGGSADTTHPAIMALISTVSGGYTECTGTVFKVDPDGTGWLITAAHCTLGDSSSPAPTAANTKVQSGNHYNSPTKTYPVLSLAHHPSYVAPGSTDGKYDVGIVHFSGASASTPTIPIVGANDGLAVGQTIQIYGYGMTVHPPQQDNNDTRNTVAKPIAQLTQFLVLHDDSNGKGTCEGDSGGPSIILQNGSEVVVAVTSFGDQTCSSTAGATRLSAALPWIQSVAGGTTSAGAGGSSGTGAGGTGAGATTGAGGGGGGLDCSTMAGQIGCCNGGSSVTFCMNGAVQTNDCMGMGCGWDATNGYYDCTFSGADPSGTYPLDCGGGSTTTAGGGGSPAVGAGGSTTTGAGAGPGTGGTGTGPTAGAGGNTTTGAGPTGAGPTGAGPTTGAGGQTTTTGTGGQTATGAGPVGAGPTTGAGGQTTGAGPTAGAGGNGTATGAGQGGATAAGVGGHSTTAGQGGTLSGTGTTGAGGTFGTTGAGGAPGIGFGGAGPNPTTPDSASDAADTSGSSGGCQMGGGDVPGGAVLLGLLALPLLRRRRDSES